MGQFTVKFTGVGGHGVDRSKKDGEIVDFKSEDSENEYGKYQTPDSIAKEFVEKMKSIGVIIDEATITHWPGTEGEVVDNLLTGIRKGNF